MAVLCMNMRKAFIFLFFIFNLFTIALFAQDAEIDKAQEYFLATAVQNWKTGRIDSKLELIMKNAGLKMPADRLEAFKLIEQYAPTLLKDIYLSVVVDSSHLLGNYLAEGYISLDDVLEIIVNSTKTKPSLSPSLDTAIVYDSSALLELSKLFIRHKTPYTPKTPPGQAIGKVYSGIIIDARGLLPVHGEFVSATLEPALFPKIWDTDMNLVFEKNMVLPETAHSQMIATFDNRTDERSHASLVGTEPLRIVARGLFGVNRTDPIISREDAAKLLSNPANLELIRQGRVIILCDSIEKSPKYPQPDENFYFAYRDVETVIDDEDDITVSQNPDDRIIKITMYNIHFVADKADILPEDYGRLDIIAEALRRLGNSVRFVIEGHTAELYRPNDQLILSRERAQTMAEELAKRGISRERISTDGFGATVPVAPSDTEENRAKNRRVEIKIIRE